MEEEDNIIVRWAQEDVETLYSVINNNNYYFYLKEHGTYEINSTSLCLKVFHTMSHMLLCSSLRKTGGY